MMSRWLALAVCLPALAAVAAQTTPLAPLDRTTMWDFARDAARLAREYAQDEIQPVSTTDGPAIQWAFQLKQGAFADVFLRRGIPEPFGALRFKVRCVGEPFSFAVKLGDADSSEWTVPPVKLRPEWQTVELKFKDWKVAGWSTDANGRLDFPTRYLALIAFDVHPGPAYKLQLAALDAVRPDPAPARVTGSQLPAKLNAGETAPLGVSLTLTQPLSPDAPAIDPYLALSQGSRDTQTIAVKWSRPLSEWAVGTPVTGTATVALSRWQSGGPGVWRLRSPGVKLLDAADRPLADNILAPVTVVARRPGAFKAEVKPYHGAPTLFLNDQPAPAMAYAAYGPTPQVFKEFGDAGVRLFSIMGTPTSHGYGLAVDTWVGPDKWDFSQLDERFRMVLDQAPDAYVFPRIYASAPGWWLDQHPEAVVTFDPGDGHVKPFLQNGQRVPSWSSPAWRAAVDEGLRRLIAHVEAQPYADHVLGYHLVSGTTEEWMMWGANDDAWTDYSPDNLAGFRRWLTTRYQTAAGLQDAWHDPAVTLATAAIPLRAARAKSVAGTLRDPEHDTPSMDYVRYIADLTAETIDHFGATVKKLTNNRRLTGVFYGYLLQLFGQRQQNAAHLAFDRVVRSPHLDFLCSPTSYAFRRLGDGTSHFMAPLASVQAHGKLWMDENDIRTSLSGGALGEWGRPADVAGDMLQQDRELANVLVHGAGQWWFDVGHNIYSNPQLLGRIAHLTKVAQTTLDADRTPAAQIALVVDGRGLATVNVGDPLMNDLMLQQVPTMARLGAPVSHFDASDLDRLANYRLIVCSPLYDLDAAQHEALDRLKDNGRVLVFCHAPSPYRHGQWQPELMMPVTSGFRLAVSDQPVVGTVKFTGNDPLVKGLTGTCGTGRPLRPAIVGADPDATVAGVLPNGQPGLLIRRYPTWTAVWCAANLSPDLLNRLVDLAGVHRYVQPPDIVWASKELLAVTVNRGGPRTVHLPQPAKVTDLYAGKVLAERATEVTVDIPAAGTVLWRVEGR